MFGIELTQANLPEIIQTVPAADAETQPLELDRFIASPKSWYFITGYVTRYGKVIDWTIVPGYVLDDVFDYDFDKIKTEWSQMVRKQAP